MCAYTPQTHTQQIHRVRFMQNERSLYIQVEGL